MAVQTDCKSGVCSAAQQRTTVIVSYWHREIESESKRRKEEGNKERHKLKPICYGQKIDSPRKSLFHLTPIGRRLHTVLATIINRRLGNGQHRCGGGSAGKRQNGKIHFEFVCKSIESYYILQGKLFNNSTVWQTFAERMAKVFEEQQQQKNKGRQQTSLQWWSPIAEKAIVRLQLKKCSANASNVLSVWLDAPLFITYWFSTHRNGLSPPLVLHFKCTGQHSSEMWSQNGKWSEIEIERERDGCAMANSIINWQVGSGQQLAAVGNNTN